jgi:hypothetical protein
MITSGNNYAGFIALSLAQAEKETIVNDVKLFSFGLSPRENDNVIRKDVPALLDKCLKRFSKVMWIAHKDNKANIAYEVYRKKHNGKKEDLGKYWRYICYSGK